MSKMACEQFLEINDLLSAHLDGETTAEEEKSLTLHLRTCVSCVQVLNDLKRVKFLLKALPPLPVPTSLHDRVFEKIGQKIELPWKLRVYRGLAATLAAVMLFVGSVTVFGYFSPEPNAAMESNVYLSNHAYHMIGRPLADRSSWSYVAGDSDFELYSEASE